ncbi:hypothetical protein [Devosia sediminis]|uniref:hypothetical protein n=1 Tax=Devosia sediminis TaxID=2798801 RepID=UPI0038B38A84
MSGHTAAGASYANPRYGAWELSSDRANIARAELKQFGVPSGLVDAVIGRAELEPFFANDPYMAANERVQIFIQKSAPTIPPGFEF